MYIHVYKNYYGIKILNLFMLLFCKRIMFVYYNFQSRAHSGERLCGARDNYVRVRGMAKGRVGLR